MAYLDINFIKSNLYLDKKDYKIKEKNNKRKKYLI